MEIGQVRLLLISGLLWEGGRGGHWTGKTTADFRVVVGGERVDIGQVRLLLISG